MPKFQVMVVDPDVRNRRTLQDRINHDSLISEVCAVTSSLSTAMGRLEHTATDFLVVNYQLLEDDNDTFFETMLQKFSNLRIIAYKSGEQDLSDRLHTIKRNAPLFEIVEADLNPDHLASAVIACLKHIIKLKSMMSIKSTHSSSIIHTKTENDTTIKEQLPALVIVIGVSTGGPNALVEIIPKLTSPLLAPIFIVQHMPVEFVDSFAERLNHKSLLDVATAKEGELVRPGICRLAAGNFHLELEKTNHRIVTRLTNGPPENSCKPAADVLFRSAAMVFGNRTLGVVLTGMGRDGCAGSRTIVHFGGRVIAQDEQSSVVWGMPGSVVEAKLTDKVLPLHEIANEIMRRSGVSQK